MGGEDRADDAAPDGAVSGVDTRDVTDGDPESFLRKVARAPQVAVAWTLGDGEVGRRIADRFRVRRCLGAGGMGIVYEADDERTQERVAIKTLHVLDAEGLYRFKSEFRSLVDILHPNLVRLSELLCDADNWFFTMELIEGEDFLTYVRARPAQLADASAQVLDGLAAIHAAGKVHRDIKPSNVLVTAAGRVVVLDFGLVSGGSELADDGAGVGTPIYMAPEQAAGTQVGAPADLYALGAMIYEALTGQAPFTDEGRSAREILQTKQNAPAPRPSAKRADVPPSLDSICAALLEPDPDARPTIATARRALTAILAERPSVELPRHFVGRGPELAALDTAFAAPRAAPMAWLLCGESGIGKSSLAREWAQRAAREHGALVLAGRCYEREHVPHKAFDGIVDALASHLRALERDEIERLRPDGESLAALLRLFPVLGRVTAFAAAPATDRAEPSELRRTAYAAIRTLLARLDAVQRTILLIDDLQWTDADSLELLRELLRPPGAPSILLLATLRPEHPALDFPGDVRRVELSGLELDDAVLLAVAFGRSHADATAIAGETRGHPLFTQALAASDLSLDARLPELLRARRASQSADARRLLDAIAVAGVPISESVASRASGVAPALLSARLAELRSAHLIRSVATGGVEVYHDRVRDTALDELADDARRECHDQLAHALEQDGAAHGMPGLLMRHFEAAGHERRAAPYAERAAERASSALAFDEAAGLYADAIRLYGADVARELHARRAQALVYAGRATEAGAAFLIAADGAPQAEKIALEQEAARYYLVAGHLLTGQQIMRGILASIGDRWPETSFGTGLLLWGGRALVAARGLDFRLREESEIDPRELLRLDVYLGLAASLMSIDFLRGAALQTKAVRLGLDLGERRRIEVILAAEAVSRAVAGTRSLEASERVCRMLDDLFLESGRPAARALAAHARLVRGYLAGQFQEAVELAVRSERFVLAAHDFPVRMVALNNARFFRLAAQMQLGRFGEMGVAEEHLRDATRREDRYAESVLRTGLAIGWLARGGAPALRDQLERMSWSPPEGTPDAFYFYKLWARAALALYERDPRVGRFEAVLRDASRRARPMFLQIMGIQTDVLWARVALARRARWRVERIAARLTRQEIPIAAVWAELLRAAIALDRDGRVAACQHLRAAVHHAQIAGSTTYAAAACARIAELEGDRDGRASALAELASAGIAEPEAFLGFVAPGFDAR